MYYLIMLSILAILLVVETVLIQWFIDQILDSPAFVESRLEIEKINNRILKLDLELYELERSK